MAVLAEFMLNIILETDWETLPSRLLQNSSASLPHAPSIIRV